MGLDRDNWLGDNQESNMRRLDEKLQKMLAGLDKNLAKNTRMAIRMKPRQRDWLPPKPPRPSVPLESSPRPPSDSADLSWTRGYEEFLEGISQARKRELWVCFSGLMGGVAVGLVLAGVTYHSVMTVVSGFLFGLLSWKGRAFAEWCDAKEKAFKARRAGQPAEPQSLAEAQPPSGEQKAP